jgi:hypothetical protein
MKYGPKAQVSASPPQDELLSLARQKSLSFCNDVRQALNSSNTHFPSSSLNISTNDARLNFEVEV